MSSYNLSHLKELESEAIFILREVASQFEKPVILFSGGKDSIIIFHLARKAFFPGKVPFPLMHIDTGHNFPETIEFRDILIKKTGENLIVKYVQDSIRKGTVIEDQGENASRNELQTVTLLEGIENEKFDCAIGGGRRDEEKARAKERFFSHRDEFGQWDPKNQRPELWTLFNGRKKNGEHFRVFPISNWTEMDVWQYILQESIELPSLYFSHKRNVVNRNGVLLSKCEHISLKKGERWEIMNIRCRTIGDMTCTGVINSNASDVESIINEVASTRVTERGGRVDDKKSEAAMEDRKKEGYF